jgi:hypothetical protein
VNTAAEPLASPRAPAFITLHGRLFTKYVALFVLVVCVALLANASFEIWFFYNEHTKFRSFEFSASKPKLHQPRLGNLSKMLRLSSAGRRSYLGGKPRWSNAESTLCVCSNKSRQLPNYLS